MKGFSYVELLLSLMVVVSISAILPQVMMFFQSAELAEDNYDFDIFLIDIYEAYKDSESILTEGANRVTFKTKNGEVSYHYTNGRLIKSINQEGFVTMMYKVDGIELINSNDTVSLKIRGLVNETLTFKK